MRALLAALAAALAFSAIVPASAPGGTASRDPGSAGPSYVADPGEQNELEISQIADAYTITDRGPGVTVRTRAPCRATDDPQTVTCPAVALDHVDVLMGDGDDRATVTIDNIISMQGGDGNDTLTAIGLGPFADDVNGDAGDDRLVSLDGFQSGGPGRDSLVGGPFGDNQRGDDGDDSLVGGGGSDLLDGGAGGDSLGGGDGDDTLVGGDGSDSLAGGDDGDTLLGLEGNDSLAGGPGADTLGSAASVIVFPPPLNAPSEGGDDRLDGGPGNDVVSAGVGPTELASDHDVLTGGDGRDLVTYEERTADRSTSPELSISVDGRPNDGAAGEGDDVGGDFERLVGGASDDRIVGGPGPEEIDGGLGADVIEGAGGSDTLDAGAGDAEGNTLIGGEGPDLLRGGAGDDALWGEGGDDALQGGDGDDNLDGGAGSDTMTGGGGADDLTGGMGEDSMDGSQPVLFFAKDGDDTLRGDEGNDDMQGGDADDTLVGGAGADAMRGGAGRDVANYGFSARAVTVTLDGTKGDGEPGERDNVHEDVEDVLGGSDQDTFTGSGQANRLDGGTGEDYVDGARGSDQLLGGVLNDAVRSRDGSPDAVSCGRGVDFAIVDRVDQVRGCEREDTGVGNRPERGQEFVVSPSDDVDLKLPRTHRFIPLQDRVNLPVASTIDASGGEIDTRFATARGERPARVKLYGGAIKIRQTESPKATVEIRLVASEPLVAAARRKRRKKPRTWVKGKCPSCQVRGDHSVNSGEGTIYLVEERCEGTLTFVREGVVRVRDLRSRRTVIVEAGERYLARAPRRERAACPAG